MHLREILRQIALIPPALLAARRIQRQQMVVRRRDEHGPIVHHRRRLMPFAHAGGEGPQRLQARHVLRIDLIQRAVALRIVGAPVHQPVLRLRIRQPRISDRRILPSTSKRRQDPRPDNGERRHDFAHGTLLSTPLSSCVGAWRNHRAWASRPTPRDRSGAGDRPFPLATSARAVQGRPGARIRRLPGRHRLRTLSSAWPAALGLGR